jgi:hypothetical protein
MVNLMTKHVYNQPLHVYVYLYYTHVFTLILRTYVIITGRYPTILRCDPKRSNNFGGRDTPLPPPPPVMLLYTASRPTTALL